MILDTRTPVILLTGFLGSGKTTLLKNLMARAQWQHTAVIINELGETGLDHLLVKHVAPEVRLLQSGCVCCSVRDDLTQTLAELGTLAESGAVRFDRVIVETTGLADPMPVMHTLVTDPATVRRFRLGGVVTVVDAHNGFNALDQHEEARRQVASADTVLLSKTDLVQASALERLTQRLSRMNASASQHRVQHGALHSDHLLQLQTRFLAPFGKGPGTSTGLLRVASTHASKSSSAFTRFPSPHVGDIQTHCFTVDEPLEAERFEHWLALLTAMRGEKLLRFKGLIHIAEHPSQPLVVHAAQHLIHPPDRLAAWPDEDRRSRLVFITQGMPKELIESTLLKYAGACATALSV
ncbi:G3E family GTPase [Hydrogenophaga palleronii]|uniref:G3E family GTPase n=1 Tax=Hydrogenophaga palleronii TaxID=65655 RepID=A0ABU1WL40_9BURK|nr:GTP-binding protein [Hydrogenophaga palleronii]MDR7149752.1 G3E family GTPase [Hydrogenophaga palleronii]